MGQKIIMENIDIPGIDTFDVYRKNGGYTAAEKALKMQPHEVIEEVKNANLRGRGGAGFPAGLKWSFIDKKSGNPRYLVVNADESEPGTFKDRYLMRHKPHMLIEGCLISSYALEANTCYIYIRGEMMSLYHKLYEYIQEAYDKGFLGKNIQGSGFDLDVYLSCGAGAYICGEETGLLESLEGKRGNPRIKPPFPAVVGLYGCPTVVNNVETIATTPWVINHGAEAYTNIGVGKSSGTKLVSACGHVRNPGVYEVEFGITMEELLYSDEYCGGVWKDRKLKAVVVGGSSVPILPANLILKTAEGEDRLYSYESLAEGGFESGTLLGSGGLIVYDETASIPVNLWNFTRFYHEESCGQCSPCREGTVWMEKVLHRIINGEGHYRDIDLLTDVADNIEGNTICPHGDASSWPVKSSIRHFRKEFEYYVAHPDEVTQPGFVYQGEELELV